MELKQEKLTQVAGIAYRERGLSDISDDSIMRLIWQAENEEEIEELRLTHSFRCLKLTGEDFIDKIKEAQIILEKLKQDLIKSLVMTHDVKENQNDLNANDLYEFRNYLFEGLERFQDSMMYEVCNETEDIKKLTWGFNRACEDLKELLIKK